ncbi:MAG: Coenzyme F420 hydrogenase/dehydrogenase, beta subunit C-terminal domain [Deltaproteobacteria bacterium]|nr:Coenzyme F420 hydrogenase/dehydrogenase, beta subunit C-terminal domain [Deltaproteobacteria bacterium]MBW1941521.1 Coenzyme F420 hydrogenase/dehydrogenase, beta subunit C-terminal domain [Deltaproteobacteria bacterium]MBW2206910.1 Coenzyme F420 hydrogenase/dehydrogenase, beta subunit C-terminal domain [Deltaproteobacteria bacterium]
MAKIAKIEVKEQDLLTSLNGFFKSLLQDGDLGAVMVPQHLPMKNAVMPTLVTDPEKINGADPLAPVFPLNAAKVVSKLTRRPTGRQVAVVLRPCEIRAFVELVKLKQGTMEDVILVGTDCYGAYGNRDYPRFTNGDGHNATLRFLQNVTSGKGTAFEDFDISPACKACEHPIPENADLLIGLLGVDTGNHLLVKANSSRGEVLLEKLELPETTEPEERAKAIEALVSDRIAYRDQMFTETSEATADIEKLTSYLANCVNCYNCRVACPVCYCKECVFVTDVFDHEPLQYLRWAKRKGIIKMPTDTVFYHITRLAHMSTACIGCGQCTNACPNDIPVMEIFRTVAHYTQKAFDYEAGRSVEDEPPMSVFREGEFRELTGGKD